MIGELVIKWLFGILVVILTTVTILIFRGEKPNKEKVHKKRMNPNVVMGMGLVVIMVITMLILSGMGFYVWGLNKGYKDGKAYGLGEILEEPSYITHDYRPDMSDYAAAAYYSGSYGVGKGLVNNGKRLVNEYMEVNEDGEFCESNRQRAG